MRSLIVGTAGHIDHGKSALVRALTGTDPDRLPEEKRRGITIDLGFADLQLGDLRLGFVDVPGHERFIKNMLAGAHGIDLLALVIAADEGVMPQTREHFDICRLLEVRQGLVVITKADLVESEMLPLVEEEARDLVRGSFLEDTPVTIVSSRTGFGLEELKSQLTEMAKQVPARSSDLTTRLPVDRAFSMKGFGAVVTGTLVSGQIKEGDELELLPAGVKVRVRGAQVHGQSVTSAEAGQRTAVNLSGIDVADLQRGMVLAAPDRLRATQIIDAHVQVLPSASKSLRSRARVRVHIGAAEVLARVRVLEDPGEIRAGANGLVQFRFEAPVVGLHGDRFVIRSYSPSETIAGGSILNPFAVKHRGRELQKSRWLLHQLMTEDRLLKLAAFVEIAGDSGLRSNDVAATTGWTNEVLRQVVSQATDSNSDVVDAGGLFLSKANFNDLGRRVEEELERFHKREPLSRGLLRETLREKVFAHSPTEVFNAVIAALEADKTLVSEKDTVRLRTHSVDLSDKDVQLRAVFEEAYENAGVEAPSIDEVMSRAGVPAAQRQHARKIVQLLIDGGQIRRVQGEMFMATRVIEDLKRKLFKYGDDNQPGRMIDVATFKELAGVSRKYAIPLLEYFDRERVTRRAGDKRVVMKP